jgi:hypothetical protein
MKPIAIATGALLAVLAFAAPAAADDGEHAYELSATDIATIELLCIESGCGEAAPVVYDWHGAEEGALLAYGVDLNSYAGPPQYVASTEELNEMFVLATEQFGQPVRLVVARTDIELHDIFVLATEQFSQPVTPLVSRTEAELHDIFVLATEQFSQPVTPLVARTDAELQEMFVTAVEQFSQPTTPLVVRTDAETIGAHATTGTS